MKTLTREKELQILKAAEQVVDLVNGGDSPNDALYKVAMEQRLTPEFVKRLAETFNTSKMLAHFKTASASNRADEFPLANASNVVEKMYPDKTASDGLSVIADKCHSTWFNPPPNFKQADLCKSAIAKSDPELSTTHRDMGLLVKRAHKYIDSLKRKAEVAREDSYYCKEMVHNAVIKAGEYFRSLDHVPFEAVESNVLTKYGSVAKPLMNAVFASCRGELFGEKRGGAYDTDRIFNASVVPYTHVDDALQWAKKHAESRTECQAADDELKSFEAQFNEKLAQFETGGGRSVPFPFDLTKSSVGSASIIAGSTIGDRINSLFDSEAASRKFEKQVLKSEDPDQTMKLRTIRTKALLNDLISNDPVISGYAPRQVISAFNELSQLSPMVSEQPALLRGLLARQLELGRTEPFEASQVVDTERALRSINSEPKNDHNRH